MSGASRALTGCLLGTAVGDALGLPFEGISARRQQRIMPRNLEHRLLFGRGMISDDTEHAAMTAQALIASGGDVHVFERLLAWKLRWWLVGIPAGTGLATLRAILKLWLGFSPSKSGVYSAGNGPAMRAPVLGVAYGSDPHKLCELVASCTRITHTDPKAYVGALAVAVAAYTASRQSETENLTDWYLENVLPALEYAHLDSNEFLELFESVRVSIQSAQSTQNFACSIGLERGVTGYINNTMPLLLNAWLSNPNDFEAAVTAAVRCGGDTDSVAAIVGGIVGSAVGEDGIPKVWLDRIAEYPRSIAWLKRVALCLAQVSEGQAHRKQIPLNPIAVFLRNLLFTGVVLSHGFRRLLPPY